MIFHLKVHLHLTTLAYKPAKSCGMTAANKPVSGPKARKHHHLFTFPKSGIRIMFTIASVNEL